MKFAQSLVFFALPLLAAASPLVARTDQCNTGSVQCCNKAIAPNSPEATTLLGLLGIVAKVQELIAVDCSPITVIGVASGGCKQQTYCCTDNSHDFISLGCSSFNILN